MGLKIERASSHTSHTSTPRAGASRSDWARLAFALVAVSVTMMWLLSGRGSLGVPREWVITPNLQPWPLGAWGLPLGVLIVFGGAATLSIYDRFKRAKSRKEQTTSVVTALVCLFLLGLVWPWSLLGPGQVQNRPGQLTLEGRFNLIAATWSDVANGYFGAAYEVTDARQFAREYALKRQRVESPAQAHLATHPPGAVLWFYSARRVYEGVPFIRNSFDGLATTLTSQTRAELFGLAQLTRRNASLLAQAPAPAPLPSSALGGALFCAALLGLSLASALPAVYGLAALGGDDGAEKRGLIAAGLWVLAPTTNLFAFTLDALVASGVAWTLFFAARGFTATARRPRIGWLALTGVMLALTTFVSIGALAAGAILAIAALGLQGRASLGSLAIMALAFAGSWGVLSVWGGFNPFEIVAQALAAHRVAALATRSYAPWVGMNIVMWALFAGWPLCAVLIKKVAWKTENRGLRCAGTFGVAAILTILLLSLGGNVRGEVERLWLFALAPLAVWAATGVSWRLAAPILAGQSVQTLVMAATLAPLVRPGF